MSYHCNKLKQVIVPDIFNHGQITTTHNPMHAYRLLANQPDSFESSVSSMTITLDLK